MYASYFGFSGDPFPVTPDATRLFLAAAHREAIGVLEYGLRLRKGFIVLSGEVGVGKTTVLRHSLRRLDPATTAIVYVLQPALTPHQLLTFIWEELSGEADPARQSWMADTGELIRHLLFRLKALYDSGKLIVIVVDEAQTMPVATLETLRLLSNLESDKQKFLQIVLAGQPELDRTLARHALRQLDQRVAVRARIRNLSPAEAEDYIRYRLDTAAGRRVDLFSDEALAYIVARARGNPRRLNIFCDNALINAMGHRAARVTLAIARDAIAPHLVAARPWSPLVSWARTLRLPAFPAVPALPALRWRSQHVAAAAICAVIGAGLALALVANLPRAAAPPALAWPARHDPTLIAALPEGEIVSDFARPSPLAAPRGVATYTVDSQNTLGQLCRLAYGDCGPATARALAAANPRLDPRHLVDGETVALPVIGSLKPVVP